MIQTESTQKLFKLKSYVELEEINESTTVTNFLDKHILQIDHVQKHDLSKKQFNDEESFITKMIWPEEKFMDLGYKVKIIKGSDDLVKNIIEILKANELKNESSQKKKLNKKNFRFVKLSRYNRAVSCDNNKNSFQNKLLNLQQLSISNNNF